LCGVLLCAATNTCAQTFAERPLRIIVAFSTGTAADIVGKHAGAEFNVKFFATDFTD